MKSNNKVPFIIAGVVGVVLAVGGGLWYVNSRSEDSQNTNQAASSITPQTTTGDANKPKTIADFLAASQTQKCTFSYKEGTSDASGTMYFASGRKMSGDFKTVTDGKPTDGNMIIANNTQYFWTPNTNKGVKIELTTVGSNSDDQASGAESASQGLDLDKNYDFNCSSWTLDESKFTVPTNVDFIDLSNIQSQLPQ